MSKTYSFPTQETLSGSLSFEILTSEGSGTQDVSDKYFSSEFSITEETEFLGGDLKSISAEFTVDYDKDGLFRSEILPTLAVTGSYILLIVTVNRRRLFIGSIIPQTTSSESFYASGVPEDGKFTIAVQCNWVLSLLRLISAEDVGNYALADPEFYKAVSANDGLGTSMKSITLVALMEVCVRMFSQRYGITVYASMSQNTPYVFFGKDSEVAFTAGNLHANSAFMYPSVPSYGGVDFCVLTQNKNLGIGTILTRGDGTLSALYNPLSEDYMGTAYDIFVGIIKSFQLYPTITYDPTAIVITLNTRVNGEQFSVSDIISYKEESFTEIARNKIAVTSKISGNSYDKIIGKVGGSSFSGETAFDFGSDNDFPGSQLKSELSLMYATKGAFHLIRHAGILPNIITNGNFVGNINGWTAESGTWAYSATNIGGSVVGCAKLTIPAGTSTAELQWNYAGTIEDNLLLSIRATLGGSTVGNGNENIKIRLKFYAEKPVTYGDPSTEYLASAGNYKWIYIQESGVFSFLDYPAFFLDSARAKDRKSLGYTKVGIEIVNTNILSTGLSLYLSHATLMRERKGMPEVVGATIEDMFGDETARRKTYVLNGINNDLRCGDYSVVGGENYYVKKIKRNYREYETEIEAINYPY